jgi:hypothetical protein
MGLARGSVSFVRFKVDGSLPADGEDFLVGTAETLHVS